MPNTAQIFIRVDEETKEAISAKAKDAGFDSLKAFILEAVDDYGKPSPTPIEEAKPKPSSEALDEHALADALDAYGRARTYGEAVQMLREGKLTHWKAWQAASEELKEAQESIRKQARKAGKDLDALEADAHAIEDAFEDEYRSASLTRSPSTELMNGIRSL